jgi:acid stress-induced BolA-like protein IbaG/YrbA
MISNEEIEQYLKSVEGVKYVAVEGDGYHYKLTIASDVFRGKPKVSRQQWVYAQLKDYITSGQLHALSMTTLTMEEWENNNG